MFRWREGTRPARGGQPVDKQGADSDGAPAAAELHWVKALAAGFEPLVLPNRRRFAGSDAASTCDPACVASSMPPEAAAALAGLDAAPGDLIQAAFVVYLARISGKQTLDPLARTFICAMTRRSSATSP
jgi:hypothetical protein